MRSFYSLSQFRETSMQDNLDLPIRISADYTIARRFVASVHLFTVCVKPQNMNRANKQTFPEACLHAVRHIFELDVDGPAGGQIREGAQLELLVLGGGAGRGRNG